MTIIEFFFFLQIELAQTKEDRRHSGWRPQHAGGAGPYRRPSPRPARAAPGPYRAAPGPDRAAPGPYRAAPGPDRGGAGPYARAGRYCNVM